MRTLALVAMVAVGLGGVGALSPQALLAQTPPRTPIVLEPQTDGPIDPNDVHMETAPYFDADGDAHRCTDWEIVRLASNEVVWEARCLTGANRVHTHLGDGQFINGLAGFRALEPEQNYRLRVRHIALGGDPGTRTSEWAERDFVTADGNEPRPLELDDIQTFPAPKLLTPQGQRFDLPFGGSIANIRLEGACCGMPLLEINSSATGNQVDNPAELPMHMPVRVVVRAGVGGLTLPALDLQYTGGDNVQRTVFLPALSLPALGERAFWLSGNGSTYDVLPTHTAPTFEQLARKNQTPWTTEPDFKVSLFAEGFQLPVSIAFIPNAGQEPDAPYFYVAELYGNIRLVRRNGAVSTFASNLLNFPVFGNFPGSGEAGLASIAIDPATGDLFASMLYDGDPEPGIIRLTPAVDRFTSTDGGLTFATRTRVLDFFPTEQTASHQISQLTFGPDGNLYVHMGDAFDINAGVDLENFNGKILRVTPAGQPVMSNPFFDVSNGITARDYVFAYGLRNPFGGAWRWSDNRLFKVENGPDRDRLAHVPMGRNFAYNGTDESMGIFAIWNWQPAVAPVKIAFLQPQTFANSGFPAQYAGRAYVTQSGATWSSGPGRAGEKQITEFVIGPDGESLVGLPRAIAVYNGLGKASCSAIAAGPDGIYFADLYPDDSFQSPLPAQARVLRLSYKLPNDCNDNNIDDASEIAAGLLTDCNANGVPDACELELGLVTDCNANGVPDFCDTTTLAPTFTFDGGAPAGLNINGDAAVVAGALRLDNAPGAGEAGAVVLPAPFSVAVDQWRMRFDFRIAGTTQGWGIGAGVYDVRFLSADAAPDELGGLVNSLSVALKAGGSGGTGPDGFVRVYQNREMSFDVPVAATIADGQWRTLEIVYAATGLSVRIRQGTGPWEQVLTNRPIPGYDMGVAHFVVGAAAPAGGIQEIDNLAIARPDPSEDPDGDRRPRACECGDLDFNNDGDFPTPLDVEDFIAVLAGGSCSTCDGLDFNGDGDFPSPVDLELFISVTSGGPCNP